MFSNLISKFSKLNRKHYLIIAGAILVLGAAGFTYYRLAYLPAQATLSKNIQTAVVQQGDLAVSVRGTGMLFAPSEVKLGFGTGGQIAKLNVKVGDKVRAGDVLAVQSNSAQFEAALATDQLSVLSAKQALDTITEQASIVSTQAQIDFQNAETALLKAEYNWRVQQVGNSSGWQNYQTSSPVFFVDAEKKLQLARYDLANARATYTVYSYLPQNNPKRTLAQKTLAEAQQKYDSALRQLIVAYPPEIQQSPVDITLTMAAAHVAQTETAWSKVKAGPDPDKLAVAKQDLVRAQAALAVSQYKFDQTKIRAPLDGTILSVDAKVGDNVSVPFISMADLSQRYVQISIDGTDINKIALNNKAEVTFDALPNQVFTGRLIQIDPNLYTQTGVRIVTQSPGQATVVKGLVALDTNTAAALDVLPLGLTATVNVIGNQVNGVLVVPIEALQAQGPGQYAVLVIENGQQKLRSVEVGLMDFRFAEIKSGLKVGDVVITNPAKIK